MSDTVRRAHVATYLMDDRRKRRNNIGEGQLAVIGGERKPRVTNDAECGGILRDGQRILRREGGVRRLNTSERDNSERLYRVEHERCDLELLISIHANEEVREDEHVRTGTIVAGLDEVTELTRQVRHMD